MMELKHFGLPRAYKILKADAYASALRMRICAQDDLFALHFCAKPSQPAQLGLVVPKKFAKRAVARNTIKRLGREFFRLHHHQLASGLWVLRLKSNINKQTLSSTNKKKWAAQLQLVFQTGQVFAQQFK